MSSDEIIADWLHVNSASGKIPKGSEIIQDPWSVNIARKRNFGSDYYHLNNGTRVDIRWTSPDFGASSSQVDENGDTTYFGRTVGPYTMLGGEQWSDDEGNELALPDGVSPTQSYYSDGSIGDGNGLIIYQSIKSRIIKSVTIRTPSDPSFDPQWKTEESVLYITEDNLLELSTKVGYETTYDDTGKSTTTKLEKQEKKYTGNVDDVDIINDILSAWNKKVPNYNVGQCELIDPQETSLGRWPAKDGNTNKIFGNGVACNIYNPEGGGRLGAANSTPAKSEKGLYYSGELVEYKSPIKLLPEEEVEEPAPVITGSQSGDVESKKNIITFNVEIEGVFLPLSSGSASGGTTSNDSLKSYEDSLSIIVDSKIGKLTLIEPGGFVFQDDFEQLGELDDEYRETAFLGQEEAEAEAAEERDEAREQNGSNDPDADPATGEPPTPASPSNNQTTRQAIYILMELLIKEGGFTKDQAAGICGNIDAESSFKFWNIENQANYIVPGGMGAKRWSKENAKQGSVKHYTCKKGKCQVFSGLGLAQWTYSRRYNMEKFCGEYLTNKGVKTSALKNGFLDTDPRPHGGGTVKIGRDTLNKLEVYLKSVPYLFEAQCAFLISELTQSSGKGGRIQKMFAGIPSGNSAKLIKNGTFINQKGGKPTQTIGAYCEAILCDFEVPGSVGRPLKKPDAIYKNGVSNRDYYKHHAGERIKKCEAALATYNDVRAEKNGTGKYAPA
jgi:hypothetical protein